MRFAAAVALVAVLAGCGSRAAVRSDPPSGPFLPESFLRSPHAKTDMDTNPANLASAVVTYSLGQLPEYIDDADFRLLPHDMEQTVRLHLGDALAANPLGVLLVLAALALLVLRPARLVLPRAVVPAVLAASWLFELHRFSFL